MRGQRPETDLTQASQKVIEMLSELVAQLVIPAVLHHLQTRDPKPSSVPCDDIKYVSYDDTMDSPTSKRKSRLSAAIVEEPPLPESPKMEEVKDLETFFDLAPQKAIKAIVKNLDKTEGTKTDSHAWKILRFLSMKMKCSDEKVEEKSKLRCDSPPCSCFDRRFEAFTRGNVKSEGSKPESTEPLPLEAAAITYPLTVSSEQVLNEVTSDEFRATSLKALTEFLYTSLDEFSLCFGEPPTSISSVDVTASDLLDTVTTSLTQLTLPRPKLFSWPWQKKKCSTVSEDEVSDTARVLKTTLQEKLRKFFCGHKLCADEEVDGMQDDPALIRLEKLISQEQLALFSNMVTNRVTSMFQEKAQYVPNLQNLSSPPEVAGYPWTNLHEELHSFIADSVKCLLASVAFPPPFWRVDQLVQDSAATATDSKNAGKGKTRDEVVSELVADQVMKHLNKSSIR